LVVKIVFVVAPYILKQPADGAPAARPKIRLLLTGLLTEENLVILSAEDDAADTIVPRLFAAGANLSKCCIVDAVCEAARDGKGQVHRVFSLTQDLLKLEALIKGLGGASLIIVDVIDSYLGATDSHKNAAVRGVLAPLKDMAARCRAAALGLTHFNKQGGEAKAVLRFTGSVAFIGQARARWIATPEMDESGEPTGRKLFLKGKNNLAPDIGGLAYRIEGVTVNGDIKTAKVVWDGSVDVTADDALAPVNDERDALEYAANWLKEFLAECARPSADVIKAATKEGIAQRTLEREANWPQDARAVRQFPYLGGLAVWRSGLCNRNEEQVAGGCY
jgi:hypothetical protein